MGVGKLSEDCKMAVVNFLRIDEGVVVYREEFLKGNWGGFDPRGRGMGISVFEERTGILV
jgi:hypothetical protein